MTCARWMRPGHGVVAAWQSAWLTRHAFRQRFPHWGRINGAPRLFLKKGSTSRGGWAEQAMAADVAVDAADLEGLLQKVSAKYDCWHERE